jgi:hypothetical protein
VRETKFPGVEFSTCGIILVLKMFGILENFRFWILDFQIGIVNVFSFIAPQILQSCRLTYHDCLYVVSPQSIYHTMAGLGSLLCSQHLAQLVMYSRSIISTGFEL